MPLPQLTEAAWQSQVIGIAHGYGWLVQHTRTVQVKDKWMTPITGRAGFPDLVLAHHQRGVLFVELKTKTGRIQPNQVQWREALKMGGAEYHLWRPDDIFELKNRLGPKYDYPRATAIARLHGVTERSVERL